MADEATGKWMLACHELTERAEAAERDRDVLREQLANAKRILRESFNYEFEKVDEEVCYCGMLMKEHYAWGSCTTPKAMPPADAKEDIT